MSQPTKPVIYDSKYLHNGYKMMSLVKEPYAVVPPTCEIK